MSEASEPRSGEPLPLSSAGDRAPDELPIERAYRLIDRAVAEMAARDGKAALGNIKARLRARAPSN